MSGIVYDARRIKAYEAMLELGQYAGFDKEWCDALWSDLLIDLELFDEFVYYLDHHTIEGKVRFEGYTLIDLFIWEMDIYNLIADSGKNTETCNKETMVLRAFKTMTAFKKDPEHFKKRLTEGFGMDKYI